MTPLLQLLLTAALNAPATANAPAPLAGLQLAAQTAAAYLNDPHVEHIDFSLTSVQSMLALLVAGGVLTALITAGTVIAYEVHTADGVWHCRQAVERHEQRLDAIASDVAKTREDVGYLRGRCGPPKDQVTEK